MQSSNGFLSRFQKQIRAFQIAYHDVLCKIPAQAWSWGGGTVLAIYHFRHRISFDIDIFVPDPQYFAFLSPKWFMEDTENFSYDYQELAHHIRVTTLERFFGLNMILIQQYQCLDDFRVFTHWVKPVKRSKPRIPDSQPVLLRRIAQFR